MKTNLNKEFLNAMSRDPGNWRGPLYFNRRDPRIIVPKFHPSPGWTMNFARPQAYIVLILIIAVVTVSMIHFK